MHCVFIAVEGGEISLSPPLSSPSTPGKEIAPSSLTCTSNKYSLYICKNEKEPSEAPGVKSGFKVASTKSSLILVFQRGKIKHIVC